jgi:hypothetical protein
VLVGEHCVEDVEDLPGVHVAVGEAHARERARVLEQRAELGAGAALEAVAG